MVSLTNVPNIHQGELARQSLLLRPALVLLFAAIALWVSDSPYPIVLALLVYAVSSILLTAGYWSRLLGSSDVVYVGMVDTNLFLGAGSFLTGGPLSPVLFLFFGLQASYFILSTPRTFVITAVLSVVVMIVSVALAQSGLALQNADPTQHPLVYLVAATGSLAMLASVGWLHSILYVARSQAKQHLAAALNAWRQLVGKNEEEKQLTSILGGLMTTLKANDEGAVYVFDHQRGTLRLADGAGLRPWFQKFPEFWPEEGAVGQAYRLKKRVIYQDVEKLRQCYGNLSQRNLEILEQVARKSDPPNYTLATPLSWEDEVFGVLVLSRQSGVMDDNELDLVEGFAAHIATVMREDKLDRQLAELNQEVDLHNRFGDLLQTVNDSENSLQEFAERLQGLVPFDAVKVAVVSGEDIQPGMGYFWCTAGLVLDSHAVDGQLLKTLRELRPGMPFLVNVDEVISSANGTSMDGWVAPELAEQGIACMAGIISESTSGSNGVPQLGILLLLHRDPSAYSAEHLQILDNLQPILAQLTYLLVTSGRWQKQTRQLDSLQSIMSLTLASGNEENVVKHLMRGVVDQLNGSVGHSNFMGVTVLSHEQRGSLTVTRWSPDAPDGIRLTPDSDDVSVLKESFLKWPARGPQTFREDDPAGRVLGGLLGTPDSPQLISFPLCPPSPDGNTSGPEKPLGMLVLRQSPPYLITQGQQDSIQQLADVAALCLHITRQSEAHARQTRELQHEDELRRSFLSYITHEFRTPLASLKTSFELVQESEKIRNLEDPYQRLLVNVNRSVATLEQLTNDLSEVANISAGGVILNKSLTSPDLIVYPVLETTAPLSHLKNQSLEIEIPPDLPKLMADAHRLEQVLTNMVSNAIKYTPQGGAIRTIVSQENGSIKFVVSDTGPGIPEEDLERVFEPFYRVPQQSKDRTPGTGLGLALAKSLVELHGGKIWVESAPQKGSTFCFTIPIDSKN